jgi:predicted transcriptional regulator
MVRDFVDRVFDGAAGGLLLHLAKDGKLTPAERDHITRLMHEADEPTGKDQKKRKEDE